MMHILDLCLSNAFELWKIKHDRKNFTFVDFCLEVAKELLQLGSKEEDEKEQDEDAENYKRKAKRIAKEAYDAHYPTSISEPGARAVYVSCTMCAAQTPVICKCGEHICQNCSKEHCWDEIDWALNQW